MHIGQWLIAGATKIKVFSPWFPRGGDLAIFTYEKIVQIGAPTFTVKVVHKSTNDTGNGTEITPSAGTWSNVSSTSFWAAEFEPLKELVRFQYELTGAEGTEMLLYRMLAPTWFNTAGTV